MVIEHLFPQKIHFFGISAMFLKKDFDFSRQQNIYTETSSLEMNLLLKQLYKQNFR